MILNKTERNRLKFKKMLKRRRQMAYEAFGKQCGCCGYQKHLRALEFHHLDPSTKDKTISHILKYKWKTVVAELRKCVLLCPTCHKEVHLGVRIIPVTIKRFDERYSTYTIRNGRQTIGDSKQLQCNQVYVCSYCRKPFTSPYKHKPFRCCSRSCSAKLQMNSNMPEKQEIAKHFTPGVWGVYTKLAKQYNVSHTTIKRWVKKYSL